MSRFQRSDPNTPVHTRFLTCTGDQKKNMSRKKRSNCKKISKKISEDVSEIIETVEVHPYAREKSESEETPAKGSPQRVDSQTQRVTHSNTPIKQKTSKDVYFAFLPDKYEPLIEDELEEDVEWKEEKERKKKEKYKKYRKNVGKALRFGWRCLVAGLQSFAGGYATPLSAAATLVTDAHRAGSKG
ncbi:required for drug-induced death protein 1 [Osmerus eperlanus]|uniref:required for drug-induced death protein 1 n=1 Tax=Osmerus eperlanus TaxID=29151 RepID=UPI002E16588B